MGLFSSTKIPQPPLPNIIIDLSTPSDKVFRPHDVVSGNIIFVPTVPIIPRAIEVSLFGQSLVWYRTDTTTSSNSRDYHHWRDNAPLFEVTTNVVPAFDLKAPTFAPGETYTYPFQFQLPAGTGNSRVGQYKNNGDTRWTVRPHLLPPSILHTSKYGSHTDKNPVYAKIEYGIRARLVCPGVGVAKGQDLQDLVVTVPLLFVPFNSHLNAAHDSLSVLRFRNTFSAQTSLLAGQPPSSIGFRQSMRDRFSSSTPKLDFEVSLEMPDLLTSGSELWFRASFNVLSKTGNVTHIPAIQFTVLKLDLQDFTAVRAPRDRDASFFMDGRHRKNKHENMPPPNASYTGQEHIDSSKRKTHLNSLPASVTLELAEVPGEEEKAPQQASSCETWFKARVPGFTPPSFTSFAISRSYVVKVKLGTEIGGKKFDLEVESHVRDLGSAPA